MSNICLVVIADRKCKNNLKQEILSNCWLAVIVKGKLKSKKLKQEMLCNIWLGVVVDGKLKWNKPETSNNEQQLVSSDR